MKAPRLSPTTRNTLWLAGLLPALLVVAFALKVFLMLGHQSAGADAYAAEQHAEAADSYGANRRLNLVERWVAPFDTGVATFLDGDAAGAVPLYQEALTVVPEEHACKVHINLALAYEALGDAAMEQQDTEGAVQQWQAGIATLAEGDCPLNAGTEKLTEDAVTVDQRLRDKLPDDQQPPPDPPPSEPPPPSEEPKSPQEQQLEERNDRGRELRQENEQYQDYDELQPDYAW